MWVSKNSTTKITHVIGTIGFDRITLSNINATSLPFDVPVRQYLPNQSMIDTTINNHTIQVSPNKIRIYGKNYIYSFGNQGKRGFEKIELHASDERTDNLKNLTVCEVQAAFQEAADDLLHAYKIDIKKSAKHIRIYAAEINVTFPVTYPMHQYSRVLHLLGHTKKTAEYISEKNELETYYINTGKTKEAKIYSKSEQFSQIYHIDCDPYLLRYEVYETEQILSQMATTEESKMHKHLLFSELTQQNLEQHFLDNISKRFQTTDQLLAKQLDFNAQMNSYIMAVFSLALQKALRTDATTFAESIFMYFHAVEINTGVPVLLDIRDLKKALTNTALPDHVKESLDKTLTNIIENHTEYNEIVNAFIGQSELYEELKKKLCNKETYQLTLYNEDGRNALIWWDNPSHVNCQNEAHNLTLDYKINNDLRALVESKYPENQFAQYFKIFRTTNTPPIYYTSKKTLEYDEELEDWNQSNDFDIQIIKDSYVNEKKAELDIILKEMLEPDPHVDQTDYAAESELNRRKALLYDWLFDSL